MSEDVDILENAAPAVAEMDVSALSGPLEALPEVISQPEALPCIPNVNGGRDDIGRFAPGNRLAAGHGNPLARRVARLRSELLRASTPDRMRAGVEALWDKFAAGDVAAGKLIMAYCLGEPRALDLIESVVRLQGLVLRGTSSNG